MDTVILLLASYGLCFGLMNEKCKPVNTFLSSIPLLKDSEGQNLFIRMFTCAYCTGFHTGWIVWGIWRVGHSDLGILSGLLFPFASSAFCYSLDVLLRRLEQ